MVVMAMLVLHHYCHHCHKASWKRSASVTDFGLTPMRWTSRRNVNPSPPPNARKGRCVWCATALMHGGVDCGVMHEPVVLELIIKRWQGEGVTRSAFPLCCASAPGRDPEDAAWSRKRYGTGARRLLAGSCAPAFALGWIRGVGAVWWGARLARDLTRAIGFPGRSSRLGKAPTGGASSAEWSGRARRWRRRVQRCSLWQGASPAGPAPLGLSCLQRGARQERASRRRPRVRRV